MTHETHAMALYRLITEVFILLDDAERRTMQQHNLSLRQLNALVHLGNSDGLSINELSTHLLCDKSNATRIVEMMKQEGLVTRQPNPNDRRYVSVRLTEAGKQLRDAAEATQRAYVEDRLKIFSPEEQQILSELLFRLRNNLKAHLQTLNSTSQS